MFPSTRVWNADEADLAVLVQIDNVPTQKCSQNWVIAVIKKS